MRCWESLSPSSNDTFFRLPDAACMMALPVVVSPVKATAPIPGCFAMATRGVLSEPVDNVHHPVGEAGLGADFGEHRCRHGRPLRGLEDHGVAHGKSGKSSRSRGAGGRFSNT